MRSSQTKLTPELRRQKEKKVVINKISEFDMAFRRRNKSYPFFSQEFLIQNHADIVFSLVIFILIGLMFEVRSTQILFFLYFFSSQLLSVTKLGLNMKCLQSEPINPPGACLFVEPHSLLVLEKCLRLVNEKLLF